MMSFLKHFNPEWQKKYDRHHNLKKADAFRSTMMVSALSYAFDKDLTQEFKDLNFPISDEVYHELMNNL